MNLQHKRISTLCESLALPVIAQSYAACAQQAVTDSRAYSDFLEDLLRRGAAGRRARAKHVHPHGGISSDQDARGLQL